jgi:hypothetical protein
MGNVKSLSDFNDDDKEYINLPLAAIYNESFVSSCYLKLIETQKKSDLKNDSKKTPATSSMPSQEFLKLKKIMHLFYDCKRVMGKIEDFEVWVACL